MDESRTETDDDRRSHHCIQDPTTTLDRLELLLEQIKAAEAPRVPCLLPCRSSRRHRLLDLQGTGPEFAAVLWSEGLSRHFDNA
ncbi:hypothetical protein [Mesorhizobium sp. ORM16]|uniref:hypothetical protein n=1 Tax=Mesorhizobium sp. ORM16 TaxID=3376989 RepID=UPI003857B4A7